MQPNLQRTGQAPPYNYTLTVQEMEITFQYFKLAFPNYTIDEIMLSLRDHCERNPTQQRTRNNQALQGRGSNQQQRPLSNQNRATRITNYNLAPSSISRNIPSIQASNEAKLKQQEEIKVVARMFCRSGVDVKLVQTFFPEMTSQRYKSYLEKINGQAIQSITDFLRYECGIDVEILPTEKKRVLKERLIKVREMFRKNSKFDQLETYFNFIHNKWFRGEEEEREISDNQAIKLYRTLLETAKLTGGSMHELGEDEYQRPQRISESHYDIAPPETFSREETRKVLEVYLEEEGSIENTSKKLNQLFGIHFKWGLPSVKYLVKECLKRAVKKAKKTKAELSHGQDILFDEQSEEKIKKIADGNREKELRVKLLKFYLASRITRTGLIVLIEKLNSLASFAPNIPRLSESATEAWNFTKTEGEVKRERIKRERRDPSLPIDCDEEEEIKKEHIQPIDCDEDEEDEEEVREVEIKQEKREEAPQEEQQVVPFENSQDEKEKAEEMDRIDFPDSPVNKLTEMTDSSEKEIGDRYTEENS